ncbi:NAD(P)H-dependent oxidoreductase [Methylosinus sp. H3A]|uniref:NADPH-dependent FMN reductase n=1 Tax=Methylosinus sp. H3A TaxID=2785786 RepID=UPI0018C2A18C|nr:NAD(P)H-dependent oxidoreductase [Methylosinus sp. H3A]MBG0811084.1 NAD(P)H-dependent oxidoreductase [Methylosinus sp. H3A]
MTKRADTHSLSLVLIGGSLRAASVNSAALAAAAETCPAGARAFIYARMAELPHFNPDDDRDPLPETVAEMRALLAAADAVLLSTPEYAGSLPGSFKNLLDWTIGAGSLYQLPVGWINPSTHGGARDTYAALRIVLDRAGADVVAGACVDVPIRRDEIRPDGGVDAPNIRATIATAMGELSNAARLRRESMATTS